MSERIRVLIADDHPVVLEGLRKLIEAEKDFDFVGEASAGLSALKLIQETKPNVAVLDISMPELNGITVAKRCADSSPNTRVILMTFHEDRSFVRQALDAGVRGYILKRSASHNLMQAIRAVSIDGLYIDPAIASKMIAGNRKKAGRSVFDTGLDLSTREESVLKMSARGLTNKEIANKLEISVKTVETHKARACDKLNIKTRSELVRFASMQGWLSEV